MGKSAEIPKQKHLAFFIACVVLIILKKTDSVATKDENLSGPKIPNKAFVRKKVML